MKKETISFPEHLMFRNIMGECLLGILLIREALVGRLLETYENSLLPVLKKLDTHIEGVQKLIDKEESKPRDIMTSANAARTLYTVSEGIVRHLDLPSKETTTKSLRVIEASYTRVSDMLRDRLEGRDKTFSEGEKWWLIHLSEELHKEGVDSIAFHSGSLFGILPLRIGWNEDNDSFYRAPIVKKEAVKAPDGHEWKENETIAIVWSHVFGKDVVVYNTRKVQEDGRVRLSFMCDWSYTYEQLRECFLARRPLPLEFHRDDIL